MVFEAKYLVKLVVWFSNGYIFLFIFSLDLNIFYLAFELGEAICLVGLHWFTCTKEGEKTDNHLEMKKRIK